MVVFSVLFASRRRRVVLRPNKQQRERARAHKRIRSAIAAGPSASAPGLTDTASLRVDQDSGERACMQACTRVCMQAYCAQQDTYGLPAGSEGRDTGPPNLGGLRQRWPRGIGPRQRMCTMLTCADPRVCCPPYTRGQAGAAHRRVHGQRREVCERPRIERGSAGKSMEMRGQNVGKVRADAWDGGEG